MHTPSVRNPLLAALLCALVATHVTGQQPRRDAQVHGVVVHAADRTPVRGARITLEGSGHVLVTDTLGRFSFPRVSAGDYVVRAKVPGFPEVTSALTLVRGERIDLEVLVGKSGAVELPEIEVVAALPRRPISVIVEFDRRAKTGTGRYITREVIEDRNPATLMDLFRTVPGMRVVCPRSQEVCVLRAARSPTCGPAYYLDGNPADPAVLYMMPPVDTEGIEIYFGPSGTPPEFERGTGCGVVLIWTRPRSS